MIPSHNGEGLMVMAFGLPMAGNEDIVPFVKYNAKAGLITRVDRVQTASGWESQEVDITDKFAAVMDLDNIQVGWAYYGPQGPRRVMVTFGKEPNPPMPTDVDAEGKALYKPGFNVRIVLSKACGGGLREFGSNASSVVGVMGELHDAFLAAPERDAGKLPIVKLTGKIPTGSGIKLNYRPVFEITGWADRPADLVSKTNGTAKPAQSTFTTAPSTGSTVKAPPTRAPAPEPETTADDFG
jgi:hypothetical protein